MWPQEEELPCRCRLRASCTLHSLWLPSFAALLFWHGIMIKFILRMALAGKWDTTWAMELRETSLLIPLFSIDAQKKRSCTVYLLYF